MEPHADPHALAFLVEESFLGALKGLGLGALGALVLAVFAAHHFNSPDYVLSKQGDGESTNSNPEKAALARTKIEAPPILTTRRERYRISQIKYIAVLEAVSSVISCFPSSSPASRRSRRSRSSCQRPRSIGSSMAFSG